MTVARFQDFLIPLAPQQAVSRGWLSATGGVPTAVTWHWTATWDLALCRRVLGGSNAERKGEASAHYGVGRTAAEGIDRYVSLNDRSWHAGKGQLARCDGGPMRGPNDKATRTAIGVETVNIGFARAGIAARPDWLRVARTNSRDIVHVQHWTDEQVDLMIEVGREIITRWPNIKPRHHHGHHDICPGYKDDVIGFPFARVLRGIYGDAGIPDVWSCLWLPVQRQRALIALGYDLGPAADDGDWGTKSDAALRSFQRQHGLAETGHWSTFVSWKAYDLLSAKGDALETVIRDP